MELPLNKNMDPRWITKPKNGEIYGKKNSQIKTDLSVCPYRQLNEFSKEKPVILW
jgi:hypothetical protein